MESPVSFTGHQEAREICLRGGKSGFPDALMLLGNNINTGYNVFISSYKPITI